MLSLPVNSIPVIVAALSVVAGVMLAQQVIFTR